MKKALKNDSTTDREIENDLNLTSTKNNKTENNNDTLTLSSKSSINSTGTDTEIKANSTTEVNKTLSESNQSNTTTAANITQSLNQNRLLQKNESVSQKEDQQEQKGKLVHESTDSFKLISVKTYDEFYKNISSILFDFEYDENEKSNIEEVAVEEGNFTTKIANDILEENNLELDDEKKTANTNTNKTINTPSSSSYEINNQNKSGYLPSNNKDEKNQKNFTDNNDIDSNKNDTEIIKKKAFILFSEFQKKFKSKTNSNEDPSKFPDSKNLRLLISSSFLEDKVFKMNIFSTNILGMSISLHAEGALRILSNKLEFGVYLTILGVKIPQYEGSLDINISEALKTLLMYNENLFNQILSLTNMPDLSNFVQEITSLRDQILGKIDLNILKAKVLLSIGDCVPNLVGVFQGFSSEFKTYVGTSFDGTFDAELAQIFSINLNPNLKKFKDDLKLQILSETKEKAVSIKNFIGEAELVLRDILSVPQSLIDKLLQFKLKLSEILKLKIRERMVSSAEKIIHTAYEEVVSPFNSGPNLFDINIRSDKIEFGFIDFLQAFDEAESNLLRKIDTAYAFEKQKISVLLEEQYNLMTKEVFESAEVIQKFSEIETNLDLFITKLKSKLSVGSSSNAVSGDLRILETLVDQKISLIGNYNSIIDLKNYIRIETSHIISSITNKISNTVTVFKAKSSVLINTFSNRLSECLNKQKNLLANLETEISDFYYNTKNKIISISDLIENFIKMQTERFQSGIFSSTIKKRFLSGKFDLFEEIINAVKAFENFVDGFKPRLIALDIANDINEKVNSLKKTLVTGLVFTEAELIQVFKAFESLFKVEGQKLLRSFFTRNLFAELKLTFKGSTETSIALNISTFMEKFTYAVDKFTGLKNTFRSLIDSAKNKISSLININGMNYSRPIVSKNNQVKRRHPIQVLSFIIWLEANFNTDLNLNLIAKANLSGIEIGFDFGIQSRMSGNAYVDLYVVHGGVFANANLVQLNSFTGAQYKFLQLAGNFKSCGNIKFLNVDIGVYIRYLRIRIAWYCFRIRFWFFRITICLPYIQFYMSDPNYLIRYISPYAISNNFCFWNFDF